MRTPRALLWLLLLAVASAFSLALAAEPPPVAPRGGLSPLPNDGKVPVALLPPGSEDPDTGPSDVIYPAQRVTLRFNHKLHMGQGASCKTCHGKAWTSSLATDSLIPKGTVCDACHNTDHGDLTKVTPGDDASGQCAYCHIGWQPSDGNKVAPMALPRANMVFTHQKHLARNIQCGQCHGAVQDLELATRDQLPRMAGCFGCHEKTDAAARGDAKSACSTCHLRELGEGPPRVAAQVPGLDSAEMRTVFASGVLKPPRWLHNAAHTPDFIERHKQVAAADSQFCANCHKEDFCTGCHDGRVRPRSVHPADYISMHPIEARMATQRCTSCHNEQSFCLTCHQRVGVSMSGPPGARDSGRFHPPKRIWSDAPRQPGHHAFEAERNLNACVSCHIERDCVVCHGGLGIGGGFNPHRSGFASGCASQMRRNPRPCFVCHDPGSGQLAQCR